MDTFHHHLHHHQNHHFDNSESSLPPGFRFHPTDEELITYYLLKKVLDSTFTGRAIAEVDLNKCEPWELPEKAKMGEKEWYFFSLRDRKYPTGLRTNRATEAGYWKATGKDREIYSSKTCSLVGMKKTLVFYRGRAPKGEKSNWVMHEYRLEGKFAYHYLSRSSKDEWVISRVFQKSGAGCAASGGGNGKKGRLNAGINLYPEVGSPSSVSLPPLLDSSSFTAAASSTAASTVLADRDSCSYDSEAVAAAAAAAAANREHVSCFSTIINGSANASAGSSSYSIPPSLFDLAPLPPPQPPPTSMINGIGGRNLALPAFPSLRSLQENLQLPFFFSGTAPPLQGGGAGSDHMGGLGSWSAVEEQKVVDGGAGVRMGMGATELDCMWGY